MSTASELAHELPGEAATDRPLDVAPEADGLPSSLIGPANGGLAPPSSGSGRFSLTEGVAFWPWATGAPASSRTWATRCSP